MLSVFFFYIFIYLFFTIYTDLSKRKFQLIQEIQSKQQRASTRTEHIRRRLSDK